MKSRYSLNEIKLMFEKYLKGKLSAKSLSDWAFEGHCYYSDGKGKSNNSDEAKLSHDILYEISATWENMISNQILTGKMGKRESVKLPEFSEDYIKKLYQKIEKFLKNVERRGTSR